MASACGALIAMHDPNSGVTTTWHSVLSAEIAEHSRVVHREMMQWCAISFAFV
jgi:hypothetical protein